LSLILDSLESHLAAVEKVKALEPVIGRIAERILSSLSNGGKILLMGNGGSAADAQHIAAELVVRFKITRKPISAIALTTDPSIVTAMGNDFGFALLFARQVEAHARKGDVVIGLSTSGTSENVFKAFESAKAIGCETIAFLGNDGGTIKSIVDIPLIISSKDTPRIQECHILVGHIICDLVERGIATDAH
jgi:D-sedoheptulose 7-phosphate isomerase